MKVGREFVFFVLPVVSAQRHSAMSQCSNLSAVRQNKHCLIRERRCFLGRPPPASRSLGETLLLQAAWKMSHSVIRREVMCAEVVSLPSPSLQHVIINRPDSLCPLPAEPPCLSASTVSTAARTSAARSTSKTTRSRSACAASRSSAPTTAANAVGQSAQTPRCSSLFTALLNPDLGIRQVQVQ